MINESDSIKALREIEEKWNNYWETAPQEEIEKDAAEINIQYPSLGRVGKRYHIMGILMQIIRCLPWKSCSMNGIHRRKIIHQI